MSTPPTYTRQEIVAWLGHHTVAKGENCLKGVRKVRWHHQQLMAEVQGTARYPYQVDIGFRRTPHKRWQISAECTCPVGYECKHAAAVLLTALAQEADNAERAVNPAVLEWLANFQARSGTANTRKKGNPQQLFYLMHLSGNGQVSISFCKARLPADGALRQPGERWDNIDGALRRPLSFIDDADVAILGLLRAQIRHQNWVYGEYPLTGSSNVMVLEQMIATRRLYFTDSRLGFVGPLRSAAARPAVLSWQRDGLGRHSPRLVATPAGLCLSLGLPHFLDVTTAEVGQLQLDADWLVLNQVLSLPPLGEAELLLVVEALRPQLPEAMLPNVVQPIERRLEPAPCLILDKLPTFGWREHRDYDFQLGRADYDIAVPRFDYGGVLLAPGDTDSLEYDSDGQLILIRRNGPAEARFLKELQKQGLKAVAVSRLVTQANDLEGMQGLMGLSHERDWPLFMGQGLTRLKQLGWRIEIRPGCRHTVAEPNAWFASIVESQQGWAVAMEVEFDGERHPLAPMLADLVQRQPAWLQASHRSKAEDDDIVILHTQAAQKLAVPAARIKPLLQMLAELFDHVDGDKLQINTWDAPRLVEAFSEWQVDGIEAARAIAERLRIAGTVVAVPAPKGLRLALRSYQLQGLAWLQYLRQHQLGGILADDMGLGKTAQTLAHLLLEKESGRLDKPALIVLPTSLVPNWQYEAHRFAPDLSVLALHGPQRKVDFGRIGEHDLVITTYALIWRDLAELKQYDYHLLILDEAQAVKNVSARAAEAVRALTTRHRLVLTGTPMENHLGELWAQFDFLLPGFLGDERSFGRLWRQPIEKNGNLERQSLLARRVRPFMLRRKKDEVARELPPKTVIVRNVELTGAQRELYETVRAAIDKKVRQAVAGKGFARSQIDILDALLKLRQVCCDPRLLKLDSAQQVPERAKLDLLMEMLPELVAEGRGVLVFSQFTSMLALIAAALDQASLAYVKLTGATRDRTTPVQRFQAGEVPIFLISLKAGGVGLNLTAADVVIHVDPWWNPAAEDQATDRAHRIGQDKPVFVYKLVVAGSIEERILALQQRKAALAAGVLGEDGLDSPKFGSDDMAALFAPLD
ncbi:DEAD/DEAH box helicase [Chitinimonas sp. BJB300]|uniref:DEAD/DEAH box helicase n=1 Tax=Chitinimonas sp. BJB300 TaxID=1559339 RepID=UPI000C0E6B8C|nr:DEAD/DEAH box helicase [Chitinimonas sp. BJB300]PHV10575.1 helicase [Chitinimonas sp. BJB300]TSJ91049.1 DEAD/DEAH box helicase [Chitinimonas sp. BJB300]